MALSEIPQNLIPNEPDLADVLAMHRKGIFLEMNCHHVGTIQSFDGAQQTAKVTINYKKTYFKPNAQGIVLPELKDYPVIVDAPVIVLGGGGYSLTFPVAAGDECVVLFNDRDIDAWFAGSSSSPNPTARLHSFADAFVLIGVRSLPNVIVAPESDGVALRNKTGTTKLKIKDNEITAQASATGATLLLNSSGKMSVTNVQGEMIAVLFDMLNAITSSTAGGYPLLLPPTYAAALTKFQSFKV